MFGLASLARSFLSSLASCQAILCGECHRVESGGGGEFCSLRHLNPCSRWFSRSGHSMPSPEPGVQLADSILRYIGRVCLRCSDGMASLGGDHDSESDPGSLGTFSPGRTGSAHARGALPRPVPPSRSVLVDASIRGLVPGDIRIHRLCLRWCDW